MQKLIFCNKKVVGVFWVKGDCCWAHLSTYLFSDLTSWTCTSIIPNFLLKVPLGSFTVGGYLLARRWLLHSPHRWVGTLRSATSSHDSWPGFRSPRDPLQHHPWPLHPTYQVVPWWHYLLLAASEKHHLVTLHTTIVPPTFGSQSLAKWLVQKILPYNIVTTYRSTFLVFDRKHHPLVYLNTRLAPSP